MLETVPEVHPDTGSSDRPRGGRELSRNELSHLKKKSFTKYASSLLSIHFAKQETLGEGQALWLHRASEASESEPARRLRVTLRWPRGPWDEARRGSTRGQRDAG